jgi:ribosomal protein S18 acetylase RimI-like enzyme
MSEPLLRPLRPAAIETVAEIANLAWQPIYASHRKLFGDDLYALLFPEDTDRKGNEMRRACAHHPDNIRICEVDGRVAGFITWYIDPEKKIGTIGNNGLHPDFTGRGLGTFMYRQALEAFRKAGMRYAKVHTGLDEGHAAARRAYERVGFHIRHEAVDYYMELT